MPVSKLLDAQLHCQQQCSQASNAEEQVEALKSCLSFQEQDAAKCQSDLIQVRDTAAMLHIKPRGYESHSKANQMSITP